MPFCLVYPLPPRLDSAFALRQVLMLVSASGMAACMATLGLYFHQRDGGGEGGQVLTLSFHRLFTVLSPSFHRPLTALSPSFHPPLTVLPPSFHRPLTVLPPPFHRPSTALSPPPRWFCKGMGLGRLRCVGLLHVFQPAWARPAGLRRQRRDRPRRDARHSLGETQTDNENLMPC